MSPQININDELPETLEKLLEGMESLYPKKDMDLITKAYHFSKEAHKGQVRRSGQPYISHPVGVAAILVALQLDVSCVVTALLHDTVEDTKVTLEDIVKEFGQSVSELVDGVTKISQITFRHTHEKQGENVRKMIVAMGKDVRVILVKLADRLHNMKTLSHMPYDKQTRIAQETLDIYAPLAGRLGISEIKVELEDLGFRYTRPEMFYDLVQRVDKKKKEREKYIDEVMRLLTSEIKTQTNIDCVIQGRPKHLYSIYKKMHMRNVDYDQVFDLLAFRVCVETVPECYEILGLVHSLWKPIPGRFKDFIAMPKTNNYQSLHTTVVGPAGERIEIQLRTHDMHLVAERGIAAHWKYKEESRGGNQVKDHSVDRFSWLQSLVNIHKQTSSSDEFLENIKTDLAESEIYVFTPQGEVKEFPEGATPIDFAYSIHTDLGSKIVAARVNGRLVSLKYRLQNGDSVEVISSKNQKPSKDWLGSCVTTRAKSKIRSFIKTEQRERSKEMGRDILERSFRKLGVNFNKYLSGPLFETFLRENGCNTAEDIQILVGYGKITPKIVMDGLIPPQKGAVEPKPDLTAETFLEKVFKTATQKKKESNSIIMVDGMSDVLVRYSRCCHPIPGDPIMGFITRGRGIAIHRADCERAFELDPDRSVDVEWTQAVQHEGRVVRLRVVSHDTSGLLKVMTETFSALGVNIHNAQIRTTRDCKAISVFDVNVKDTTQLSDLMHALQKIKGIIGVTRITKS